MGEWISNLFNIQLLVFIIILVISVSVAYKKGYNTARQDFKRLISEVADNITYELREELRKTFNKAVEKLKPK